MGTRPLKVKVRGAPAQLAPRQDTVVVELDEDPPLDMKLVSLTFLVVSRRGQLVYRETWPASAIPSKDAGTTVANRSAGPPGEFSWNGLDNQAPRPKDAKGREQDVYVTPLDSPYTFRVVAELEKGAEPEDVPPGISEDDDVNPCSPRERGPSEELVEDERLAPILTELRIRCAGGASTSYTVRSAMEGRLPRGPEGRFSLALGHDRDVHATWVIEDADTAKTLTGTLELFSIREKAAIWTYPLDEAELARAELTRDQWDVAKKGTDVFFEDLLVLRDAPYELRLTLAGDEIKKNLEQAWTYVDVLVASLQLHWGLAKTASRRSPPTTDAAFKDLALKEEVLLLRGLKGKSPPDDPDAATLADLRSDDEGYGLVRVGEAPIALELRSNLFYTDMLQWENSYFGATLYPRCWGDGPRLPLVAKLEVVSASGKAVAAPKALVGAQLLWDWEDPCLDKEQGLASAELLRFAFRHVAEAAGRPDQRCDDDSPVTTNCHREHGGKVGSGAAPVFPPRKGYEDVVPRGGFPFEVKAFARRPWAALSTVYTGSVAELQGQSGVLFQPSRIAGDTYRVRVYLYRGVEADFDHTIDGPALWAAAEQAGLPRASTPPIEMWRRVDLLRYYKKNGTEPALDVDALNAKLHGARLRLYPPRDDDAQAVTKMFGPGGALHDILAQEQLAGGNRAMRAFLADADQLGNDSQFHTKTWTAWVDGAVRHALHALAGQPTASGRVTNAHATNADVWATHAALSTTERASFATRVAEYYANHGDQRYPGAATRTPMLADNPRDLEALFEVYVGASLFAWFIDDVLRRLIGRYIKDPRKLARDTSSGTLVARSGLHLFHFGKPLPTKQDLRGQAFKLTPMIYGGAPEHEGQQGMCYFSAVPNDDLITFDATPLDDAGQAIPGRLGLSPHALALSADILASPSRQAELQHALTMLANAAAFKVLERVDKETPLPPVSLQADTKDTRGIHWERSLDLWQGYVVLGVRGLQPATVDHWSQWLRDRLTYDVQTVETAAIADGEHVYLSRHHPFDVELSLRLRFGWRSNDITREDGGMRIDVKALEWLRGELRTCPLRLEHVYVYSKQGSQSGRERARRIKAHLEGLGRIVARRVKINPPVDVRTAAEGTLHERQVHLSLQAPYQATAGRTVRFAKHSASLYKDGVSDEIHRFADDVRGAAVDGILPVIRLYYRDTKRGRERRTIVANYLTAVLEADGPRNATRLEPVYDVITLAAHEIGHTLFLKHAPPLDSQWGHHEGYNCIMNYDAAGREFCGICQLQLRGWDIGRSGAFKLDGAPRYTGANASVPTSTTSSPAVHHIPPPLLPPPPDGSVSAALDDSGLVLQRPRDMVGFRVTAITVFAQGGPQGGLNTCGFHSLKNAFYLQHYVKWINASNDGDQRRRRAEWLHKAVLDDAIAPGRFKDVFVGNAGSEDAPAPRSWLKIAQDKGGLPQGPDKSIGAEHQLEILAKVRAGQADTPARAKKAMARTVADEIAVSLDFADDHTLVGGPEVAPAIRRLHALRDAGAGTAASFTCAVGRHFIAITANRYGANPGDVELLVADSLGSSLYANEAAVLGVIAWITDATRDLAVETFERSFFADLRHRLPCTDGKLDRPAVNGLGFEEMEELTQRFEAAVGFLDEAHLLAEPAFAEHKAVFDGFLQAFEGRLGGLDHARKADLLRLCGQLRGKVT